jgi:hypothetical protein
MPRNRAFAKKNAQRRKNFVVLSGLSNILDIPYLFTRTNVVQVDY